MSLSPSSDSAVVDCNVVVVVLAVVGGSRSLTLDRSLLIIELFLLSSVLNKFGLLSLLLGRVGRHAAVGGKVLG